MSAQETVLLVEEKNVALRQVVVGIGTSYIIERPAGLPIREWRWLNGEITNGLRIFREIVPPPPPEPPENPKYDELHVKL